MASGCSFRDAARWRNSGRPAFNVPLPTLGGLQLWTDHRVRHGWRLQRNWLTGHWRVLDPRDVRRAWGGRRAMDGFWRGSVEPALAEIEAREGPPEKIVVCVHGLGLSKGTWNALLADIRERSKREGRPIEAWAVNYASTRGTIDDAAAALADVLKALPEGVPVVLACHSMGGLAACGALAEAPVQAEALACVGTPFGGSSLANADSLGGWALVRLVLGPAVAQLATSPRADERFPLPKCPTLAVAGSRPPEGYLRAIPGDDDILVSVASALAPGADETLVVETNHVWLPRDARAREKILEIVFR